MWELVDLLPQIRGGERRLTFRTSERSVEGFGGLYVFFGHPTAHGACHVRGKEFGPLLSDHLASVSCSDQGSVHVRIARD